MIEIDFRNQIDKIKEQIDIVDLIGSRIELKPNNTARCPFHDDHNPSFSINVREQYWYCFSCAKGGDVIRFIELFDKKPFYEVLTELAEKVGISLKPLTPEQKQEFEDEKVIDNIREDTVAFYSGQLTDEAKKYLTESRKLTEVTITENRLGFARGGLQNFLVNEKGYSLELCIKASVLIKKEDGTIRDYFYQQVIIPTIKRGNVVYITGRILGDNKPSYFHQQGTRNYLYGEDNLSEEKVIIVEGFFDVLTIKQMDYPVVGLIGVSLNPTHLKKFSNCETALLLLDPDNAGENAIVKVGKLFGTRAKVLLLPDEQDPDEFFQAHTKEEIDEFLSKAQDFYSYQLQLIDKDTNKKELPKVLEPLLRQMSELNEILWGIYLDEIKVRFNLSGDERSAYRKQLPKYRKEQELEAIKKLALESRRNLEGDEALGIAGVDEDASEADKAVQLSFSLGCELLLDQEKEPVIVLPEKPLVAFPVDSREYRRWLSGNFYAYYEKGLNKDTFNSVVHTLEGKAYHEGKKITLYNRAAHEGDNIYYDLGNDKTIIHINPNGWEETSTCPIKFRRFKHQLPQTTPLKGGKIEALLKYVNITDKNSQFLFITYPIVALVADISRVMPILIGDPGSAKSTGLRVLRSLIDPSSADLLIPPTNIPELALAANHHYCAYFDNLSYLTDDYSDVLCRLVSGIGFTKRKLWSDSDDILYNQIVAVGITGINLVATKPDLLDRCLILSFRRISDNERKDEEEFWEEFNYDKPYILGAIFTHLSTVLGIVRTLKLHQKPRMATYAKYACAAAIAIGRTSEEFLTAFAENVTRQNRAAIDSSPVAQVIIEFMSDKTEWHGSSSQLHVALKALADKSTLEIGGKNGFPKASNWLWKKITPVRPNLNALNIYPFLNETNTGSIITISKKSPDSENTAIVATQPENTATSYENAATDTATTPITNIESKHSKSDSVSGTMAIVAVDSHIPAKSKIETFIEELRAKNDRYASNFPLKSPKDYEPDEFEMYLNIIRDYKLDTNPNESNVATYQALAKEYEEEIKKNQEGGGQEL